MVSQFQIPVLELLVEQPEQRRLHPPSTVSNVVARHTTSAVMQVSGSRTVLAKFNPPSK